MRYVLLNVLATEHTIGSLCYDMARMTLSLTIYKNTKFAIRQLGKAKKAMLREGQMPHSSCITARLELECLYYVVRLIFFIYIIIGSNIPIR